jgi:flagellar motor switch/type III secretory pathway protein FliN
LAIAQQAARYARLPLALEPKLGECTMPLGEVAGLAPGSVLRLSRPLGSEIDVHVAGAPFGSAELVRVGGTLAVRFASFRAGEHDPNGHAGNGHGKNGKA